MPGVRFDHIALALPRIADAVPYLAGVLGGVPAFGATGKGFRFGQWRFANRARIEVLEPLAADSFLHRFLARAGGGIHHVTFKVPDLRAACARAEAAGYDVVGYDDSHPHWKEAFLHPKQALGIVVQMAEASGGDEAPRAWEPPARVDDPPPPVAIVGLRMRAASRERADAQWVGVLGGAAEERDDATVVYRWGASPLRIAVEIAPAADEGPLVIEYASERAVVAPAADPARLHRLFAPAR